MYCTSCGNKLSEDSRFCEKCGAPCKNEFADNGLEKDSILKTNHHGAALGSGNTGISSLKSLISYADSRMDKLELDKWQKITGIVAVCTMFAFLICVTGSFVSWGTAAAGIMLLMCCMKKKRVDSMEFAITWTVFSIRFMITDAGVLFGGNHSVDYTFLTFVMRLAIYGTVAVYV